MGESFLGPVSIASGGQSIVGGLTTDTLTVTTPGAGVAGALSLAVPDGTSQSVANTTSTTIVWGATNVAPSPGTQSFFTTNGSNGVISNNTTGSVYAAVYVSAFVSSASATSGTVQLLITGSNGASSQGNICGSAPVSTAKTALVGCAGIIRVPAGASFTVAVYQDSGAAMSVQSVSSGNRTILYILRI